MKDLVIGTIYNYDWHVIKYWVNSLNTCGFTGDKALVVINCSKKTIEQIESAGVKVILIDNSTDYQPTVEIERERFLHISKYLSTVNYRFVLTTDVRDVVFQKNPSEFLEKTLTDKRLLFSSESITIKDDMILTNKNYKETFGDKIYNLHKNNEIFNAGVIAGTCKDLRQLCFAIYTLSTKKPVKNCDQSVLNYLIQQEDILKNSVRVRSEDSWAAQIGTTGNHITHFDVALLEPKPKLVNGLITTSTGSEFYIVHQYDRNLEFKQVLHNKFDSLSDIN